jgi:CNT family concentrative nucleoside transporter
MLIAFIGLIALVNGILGGIYEGLSVQAVLGRLFAPVAWLLGVAWDDCATVGNLLGTRIILNEFVAYSDLGRVGATLDQHSVLIATYALCGFANLGSIAMEVGGIGALAPSRKSDIARLGLKAMAAGTMANFMTAAIAGMLL